MMSDNEAVRSRGHDLVSTSPSIFPLFHTCKRVRLVRGVAIDLVEYKTVSRGCNYVLSVIDHLARFVTLAAIPNKEAITIARTLVDRVFSVFGVPEGLHSDQGKEFENQLVIDLQTVFACRKTRTTPYRPQGSSVLVHSTMHNMLALYCEVAQYDCAQLLQFVQMTHNTAHSSTI